MRQRMEKLLRLNRSVSFQTYYARTSLLILCAACLITCSIVCLAILLFGHAPISLRAILACLITCFGTMVLGGIIIYHQASEISQPLEDASAITKEIASGNFEVTIPDADVPVQEIQDLNRNFKLMAQALKKMEYLNRDFMNNVSHEFKTPISVIAGFVEILQDDNLPEHDRREYLTLFAEEAERLSHLADNMLNMSRLDHQMIVTRRESVNISEQLRKTCILLAERWAAVAPEFDIDLPELYVTSDPDLTQQIWINLLDNAIKYSEGTPMIHISGFSEANQITVWIRDEGIGMTEAQMERMYERFYQGDTSRLQQGNGLGLSIVYRLLELLGGEIRCTSTPEVGTKFEIWLKMS